jgi:uncharacterized membrane protein YqaE (UPF0057 family)
LYHSGVLYLVAVVLPPLAVLLAGKPFQAIISFILQLTLIGWAPATIHALFVVNNYYADRRANRMIKAISRRQ